MPAATALATNRNFDSVASILDELNGIYQQQAEIRETLEAKGVPAATINMLAKLLTTESAAEFEDLCRTAVKVAADQYGASAAGYDEVESGLYRLNELDEDALFVRRVAKGMDLNPQAISMLTNIVRQNTGDGGRKVLNALIDYASQCGIELEGLRVIEGGSQPASVLPVIDIAEPDTRGWRRYKDVAIELSVALVVTYTALSLLT